MLESFSLHIHFQCDAPTYCDCHQLSQHWPSPQACPGPLKLSPAQPLGRRSPLHAAGADHVSRCSPCIKETNKSLGYLSKWFKLACKCGQVIIFFCPPEGQLSLRWQMGFDRWTIFHTCAGNSSLTEVGALCAVFCKGRNPSAACCARCYLTSCGHN